MKKFYFLLILSFFLFSCKQNHEQVNETKVDDTLSTASLPVRDGIFIHITESYGNPHKVLMPLKMALMMAEDKDVLIYMDIHAVELLVKEAKDLQFADFESVHTYIKKLAEKKVSIMACPTCLKIAGFKPDDLREGVQVANKEKFFNFTRGRIITLDY